MEKRGELKPHASWKGGQTGVGLDSEKENKGKRKELCRKMRKKLLAISLCFALFCPLITLTWVSNLKVSASLISETNLDATPLLPENLDKEPASNFTTEDYLNTTNPYTDIVSPQSALDEVKYAEGSNPVYVLVFADEEERLYCHEWPLPCQPWYYYAYMEIERGDEALVSKFGIDIRILGFLEWNSRDNQHEMSKLLYELEDETKDYINQYYHGEQWSGWVDAIIGITAQIVFDYAGCSFIGGNVAIWKWQVHWMDDNTVHHEVSHWFEAEDHEDGCCVMATGHSHFQTVIWEDGPFVIFQNIPCCYTSYSWCPTCYDMICSNREKFGSTGGSLLGVTIPIDMVSLIVRYITLVLTVSIGFTVVNRKIRRVRN